MKIKAYLPLVILFSIVASLELYGEELYHTTGQSYLLFITKPLLMPILMLLFWLNTKLTNKFDKLIFVGFLFGWMGDVILMFDNNNLFVFGLASFLICHIMYIIAFYSNIKQSGHKLSLLNKITLGLLPLFYLIVLYTYIFPYINGNPINKPFLIPVTFYAITIVTMTLFALWRIGSSTKLSTLFIIIGAFIFVISDSIIAINKFVSPFKHANIYIMFTYCLAQLWITTGSILHYKKAKK